MKKQYAIYSLIFIILAAVFTYEYMRPEPVDWKPHLNAKSAAPFGQKFLINHLKEVFDSVEVVQFDFYTTAMEFKYGEPEIYPLTGTERTIALRPPTYRNEWHSGNRYSDSSSEVFDQLSGQASRNASEDENQDENYNEEPASVEYEYDSTATYAGGDEYSSETETEERDENPERLTIRENAKNSAYVITNMHFSVDETDFFSLFTYAGEGRQVLIATEMLSKELALNFQIEPLTADLYIPDTDKSNTLSKAKHELIVNRYYRELFTQSKYTVSRDISLSYFNLNSDCPADTVLVNSSGFPVMIAYACGKGKIYLCSTPLLFTNFSVLHDNRTLVNDILKLLPADKVYWDDYYKLHHKKFSNQYGEYQRGSSYKRVYRGGTDRRMQRKEPGSGSSSDYNPPASLDEEEEEDNDRSILSFITDNASLSWAWYTLLLTLLLYMISSSRRRQRIIPVIEKLKNTTLEFVQMIARLYYLKKDHRDIAVKKINYFQEYLRTRYYHKDLTVDEQNIELLAKRSNKDPEQVRQLLELIHEVQNSGTITEIRLHLLSQRINEFKS